MSREETAAWLQRLFEDTREFAVVLMDCQGGIASWSRGACNVFGYEPDEVIGRPISIIFTDEDREADVPAHELAMAQSAGHTHDDRWHQRKDGSRFWASGAVLGFKDRDGALQGFAKIVRDRTDLRTQILTLKNRLHNELLERSSTEIFLATLAHELRNPLTPLMNAAQLVRLLAGETDTRYRYPLQVIDRQLAIMRRLVDDLMDVERLKQGKLQLAFKQVTLQDALNEAITSVRPAALARGQHMQALPPPKPIEIELDPDRFQQIMVNLLGNAVKYTPPGGRIWVKCSVETVYVAVQVEDTGAGIAPELQPRLFELFTQGDADATKRESGLGIGLALVKELVSLHNGTIAVRSEGPGKGSEFTVRLPLRQPGTEVTAPPPRQGGDV